MVSPSRNRIVGRNENGIRFMPEVALRDLPLRDAALEAGSPFKFGPPISDNVAFRCYFTSRKSCHRKRRDV